MPDNLEITSCAHHISQSNQLLGERKHTHRIVLLSRFLLDLREMHMQKDDVPTQHCMTLTDVHVGSDYFSDVERHLAHSLSVRDFLDHAQRHDEFDLSVHL